MLNESKLNRKTKAQLVEIMNKMNLVLLTKVSKKKATKRNKIPLDSFGNRVGSIKAMINESITNGIVSCVEIRDLLNIKLQVVHNHISELEAKGIVKRTHKGVFELVDSSAESSLKAG